MTNLGSKFNSDCHVLLIFSAQRSKCSLGMVHKATHLKTFFDAKCRLTREQQCKGGNTLWETLEETRTHTKTSRNDMYCARSRTTREDKRKEAREQEKGEERR